MTQLTPFDYLDPYTELRKISQALAGCVIYDQWALLDLARAAHNINQYASHKIGPTELLDAAAFHKSVQASIDDVEGWGAIDGRADAPTGTPQYPTYFTGLNGISAYAQRPDWQVAGVDYRVGVNTGVSLKDPATITSGVADLNLVSTPKSISIQADCTLDGYDFTLGGWWRIVTNGHVITIRNSKLENFCVWSNTTGGSLTMEYCEIDGLGSSGETDFGTLLSLRCPLTMQYCWLHDSQGDMIDVPVVDVDVRFCLFDTMGYSASAHADGIQFAGDGTSNATKIMFNTYVHAHATAAGPSSFVDLEMQLTTTAVMNDPEVAYNVASYTYPSNPVASTFYRTTLDGNGGMINNANVHDNWADPTNILSVIYDGTPGTGYTKSGNKLLTTGASF